MNTFRDDLHRRCECGHERIVHGGFCGIMGCECKQYREVVIPPKPRVRRIKPLDSPEPKMFEVEV